MRIIAFGDVHMALGNFQQIPEIDKADLVVITGDLTNYGNRRDAEEVLTAVRAANSNLLALPGNLDEKDVGEFLLEIGISLHGTGHVINSVGLFGVGGSNPTPFNTPGEYEEGELTALLVQGYEQVQDADIRILVAHPPPLHTKTDRISAGVHVGSQAVRRFIEEYQPDLCLTGHIHEARCEDHIGQTPIINPGMIKDGGWVEVTIDNGLLTASLKFLR